ncbi:response regulator transcription factor [Galbibacter sp. PAP.153]|uniref:response regulator transcription factor n=1 Tax=Galbibacter sp. PAP.153 TaxID=3104623 RepID=UPI003009E255
MINPSIIIADDHPLLLKGLHDFLVEGKFNVLASAQDGNSAYNLIIKYQPDIAILDIEMPKMSGLEIALACRNNKIGTKIILITLHKEPQLIIQAKDLNVNGYILKEYAIEEIKICLEKVMHGEQYFSPAIMDQINKDKFENEEILQAITPSERKILRLIAKEKTNKEIAEILFISIRTVEKHRSNIITKLGVSHKTNALLLWAKDHQDILLK